MGKSHIELSDFIESASLIERTEAASTGNCSTAPCQSCGGGCYGCQGSKGADLAMYSKSILYLKEKRSQENLEDLKHGIREYFK